MKNLGIIVMLIGFSQIALAETRNACFSVEGMTCATCTVTTKAAIKKLKGIKDVQVSLDEKSAVIKYDDALTSSDEIKNKIDSVGYKATSKQCDKG
ncbi:MAG: cation transporter [Bdellovibrionales bacterium]|nr:cation transporter [Bdellovibrionales bacterium]NUM58485.1 heavy-metal-associated domain-containing protein [Pseudobdellovibrionaceae bacterium]